MRAPEERTVSNKQSTPPNQRRAWLITLMTIGAALVLCGMLWFVINHRTTRESEQPNKLQEDKTAQTQTVEITPDAGAIRLQEVGRETPTPTIRVAGSIEPNPQKVQEISSLAAGRVQAVRYALGDVVSAGAVLLVIQSPQVAEMHGKLHEAETKLVLSRANLARAKQAANRVSILKAKASLDEAQSTLKRTEQLVGEGLSAGKDLVAAKSDFERAKAEYNFQKNISLNKEVADATADVKTSETEAKHIRESLQALDAQLPSDRDGSEHDISSLLLRAPISGVVTERTVNPGAGVEAGKPLITIADTSSLWVIANVPENQMQNVHLGMPARVLLDGRTIAGNVSYIDPRLNEDTRTSRVRVVISNPNNRMQAGTFVQVELLGPSDQSVFYVPSSAVQQVQGKNVVFVQGKNGVFVVRAVEVGEEIQGLIPVQHGLAFGEKIAVDGAFVLKSKLLKGQLGDDD